MNLFRCKANVKHFCFNNLHEDFDMRRNVVHTYSVFSTLDPYLLPYIYVYMYMQPDAKETEWFWTKIWQSKNHNEKAKWINNMTKELEGLEEGPKVELPRDLLKTTLKKISNWKTPGHDGIHSYWFKKLTSIHDRLALEMNRCLQGEHIPKWMTKGETTLTQKDQSKGTTPNNYRPITCLPMRTTQKNTNEDWLQPSKTILTTPWPTEWQ